ncbi:6889_t:CDS:1, partial [Racocetra persica]
GVSKISEYLHTIADCLIRWNSSYLIWNRLLKLKNHINLLVNLLAAQSNSNTKK